MVDWDLLRFFSALYRTGTLAGAARQLRVNKTTVARRIAALEAALATRLFVRSPEGYLATPAAEEILADVQRVEAGVLAVQRRLSGRDTRLEGRVRVTVSETLARRVLEALASLRATYPRMDVDLRVTSQTLDLGRRESDVAVRMKRPEQPELIGRRAGQLLLAVYASTDYVRRRGLPQPGQLAGHDVLVFDGDLAFLSKQPEVVAALSGGTPMLRTNGTLAMKAAVASGHGVAVLPCVLADEEPGLVQVSSPFAGAEVWLVTHRDVRTNARVRAVRDQLTAALRALGPSRGSG